MRAGFGADTLGQDALRLLGNACFAVFVAGVLAFTVLVSTYHPEDPLLRPSSRITAFLTSTSNATFLPDDSALRTGEDFLTAAANQALPPAPFLNLSDIPAAAFPSARCDAAGSPVDCADPEVFHAMMRSAIEHFADVHFYGFGKPVRAASSSSACDMAWRFRPKDGTPGASAAFYKDYRRFEIAVGASCTPTVVSIGGYHSGANARRKKKKNNNKEGMVPPGVDVGFGPKNAEATAAAMVVVPVVGEAVDDSLPAVESESSFTRGRYLIYMGGGDRCKSMNHYLWSFLCALGEARYLNRTLVMDLRLCLSSMYASTKQDQEGKDFRFYFDFAHLKASASVLDQGQFWTHWGKWHQKDGLRLHFVEGSRVIPMALAGVEDALVMRSFGNVEPDNYWYRVCEGEAEAVVQRPWELIWKSRRLMDIVSGISSNMSWDFDAVHVVRGEKAKNTELWPNLAADTSPDALLDTLSEKVEDGRNLYIATNEPDTTYFDPLRDRYNLHFLDDFRDLWGVNSEWYAETQKLNNGVAVEFDGYMRVEVDTEVFLRGKKQIETFNDLTHDCKDGVNTCRLDS
uniref:Zinc metalloproteinase nas-8 n=1 Tax=Anthurium amnicola TaxID=1678845 RepID=A0A1D1YV80_9ARAE